MLQLTENDQTKDMPTSLPDDFYVPDTSYDASVKPNSSSPPAPAHIAHQPVDSSVETAADKGTSPQLNLDQVDYILKQCGIPQSTLETVHDALSKQVIDSISANI